jgi:hypothetical protein
MLVGDQALSIDITSGFARATATENVHVTEIDEAIGNERKTSIDICRPAVVVIATIRLGKVTMGGKGRGA